MDKSKYDMIALAEEGASLVFDIAEFDRYQMKDIASSLREECSLELHGCDAMDTNGLRHIAQAAPGQVKFVF